MNTSSSNITPNTTPLSDITTPPIQAETAKTVQVIVQTSKVGRGVLIEKENSPPKIKFATHAKVVDYEIGSETNKFGEEKEEKITDKKRGKGIKRIEGIKESDEEFIDKGKEPIPEVDVSSDREATLEDIEFEEAIRSLKEI